MPLEEGFRGFGRSGTADDGWFEFVTVKPGRVPAPDGRLQAPHIVVGVFARGLLKRLVTRIYFPDEEEANAADPVLSELAEAERATLVARRRGRRPPLRHPPPGRRGDDVLPRMTAFGPLFVPEQLLDAVSERAWLEAMLEIESALARAEAAAGIVPAEAADAIAEHCRRSSYDFDELLEQGRAVGNPAEPLVRALRDAVGGDAARYVHRGATSQDVMDTASMLVARRALDLILAELDRVAASLAELAESHRSTPMAARTLLQQALPTTFGCKVAGWLVAVLEARHRLEEVRTERLAVQLGGAAGTLAALGERRARGAPALRGRARARRAGRALAHEPDADRRARRGARRLPQGCSRRSGSTSCCSRRPRSARCGERDGGGSSTLPQKRNPVSSTLARACAAARERVRVGALARRSSRSTSAPPAPGTPSGRRSPERSRTRAAPRRRSQRRSRRSRSTPSGCAQPRADGRADPRRAGQLLARGAHGARRHEVVREAALRAAERPGVVRGGAAGGRPCRALRTKSSRTPSTRRRTSARPRHSSTVRSSCYRSETA